MVVAAINLKVAPDSDQSERLRELAKRKGVGYSDLLLDMTRFIQLTLQENGVGAEIDWWLCEEEETHVVNELANARLF